ncbi:hypothetical protein BC829DRAFT_400217 [Chytridium lagenaria]|nr:hypothetical protein BC829DRAFT_400217 [Chytridium lagenaria]
MDNTPSTAFQPLNDIPLSVETMDFDLKESEEVATKTDEIDDEETGGMDEENRPGVLVSATVPMSMPFSQGTGEYTSHVPFKQPKRSLPLPGTLIPVLEQEEVEQPLIKRRPKAPYADPRLLERTEEMSSSPVARADEAVLPPAEMLPMFKEMGITYLAMAEPKFGKRIYVKGFLESIRAHKLLKCFCATLCDGTAVLEVSLSAGFCERFGDIRGVTGSPAGVKVVPEEHRRASSVGVGGSSVGIQKSPSHLIKVLESKLANVDGVYVVEFPASATLAGGASPISGTSSSAGRTGGKFTGFMGIPTILSVSRMTVEAAALVWDVDSMWL